MLTAEEFESVLQIKTDANRLFGAGESERALGGWTAAIAVYEGRVGTPEQRFEKGKLWSNKAEAAIKLGRYAEACDFATEALECNPVDTKARFRRARALLGKGGFEDLMLAQEDIKRIKADGGTIGAAEAKLLHTAKGPLLSADKLKDGPSAPTTGAPSTAATEAQDAAAPAEDDAAPAEEPKLPVIDAEYAAAALSHAEAVSKAAKAAADSRELEEATAAAAKGSAGGWSGAPGSGGGAAPLPSWVTLLPDAALRHGWLIDVYRTRVDDDCREAIRAAAQGDHGGSATRHGLGAARPSRLSVLSDFLHFCKLAVARGVVPAHRTDAEDPDANGGAGGGGWDWADTLGTAGGMLDKGFHPEKCGAEVRYGPRAAGTAMRRLGSMMYDVGGRAGGGGGGGENDDSGGSASEEGDGSDSDSEDETTLRARARKREHACRRQPKRQPQPAAADVPARLRAEIQEACGGDDTTDQEGYVNHQFTFDRDPTVFDDVGGVLLWRRLNEQLKRGRLG